MNAAQVARDIEAELRREGDPGRAEHEKAYLKSELQHFGASVPAIRRIAKAFAGGASDRDELLRLVQVLWARPVHECRMAAVELLDLDAELLQLEDLELVERLLRDSRTWGLVDGLAASVVGALVERYPELGRSLDRWAVDDDFWVRRSALLALLIPLRRGEGDFERFSRYADAMLGEREFFIRKAIGWVLRETGRKRPDLVYEWLEARGARVSGVTVREAVKHLSEEQRETIMSAYRRARSRAS
jgi:3-methyladenine DNA glycosylase AlkD